MQCHTAETLGYNRERAVIAPPNKEVCPNADCPCPLDAAIDKMMEAK